MRSFEYENKKELLDELNKRATLFIREFSTITNETKDTIIPEVDRTPAQMIAYQLGWMNLVQSWEEDELNNKVVIMPSKDYKWNALGDLYQHFYKTYEDWSIDELIEHFNLSITQYNEWIATLSHTLLFEQGYRKWTGNNPDWPMVRWIHINTIAPFKTFRTKIRKWKKVYGQV